MASQKSSFIPFALAAILVVAFAPVRAHAAALQLSAGQGYAVGQTFPVTVLVSTAAGESANAVSATLSYAPSQLKLVSISTSPSIISMWPAAPTYSNTSGSADLEGIVLNPGYSGQGGTVATLMFKAVAVGSATISFSQASVLANDGQGTNILTAAPSKTISIGGAAPASASSADNAPSGAPAAPSVVSSTNPDPNKWYNAASPTFSWKLPPDVSAVRLSYDDAPIATPTVVYKPAITNKTLEGVADGTHYLHIQFKNDSGWGAVAHFKFQTDTTPPAPFKITLAHPENVDDPRPILYFNTTDAASGMDHYDLKFGDDEFLTITADKVSSNPYTPPTQEPGTKTVLVNAYDKAGNVSTAATQIRIEAIESPVIDSYQSSLQQGDILRIEGKSYPGGTVTVTLKDQNGIETSDIARVGATGRFSLVWSKALDAGIYTFTARVTDAKGAQSYPTPPYTVGVEEKVFYRIGSFIIDWLSVVMIILGAGVVLVGCVMYSVHRLTLLRRKMRRALNDAEKTVHQRFQDLQNEMVRHISILESARTKRQLTKEEKAILASFKKEMDVTEKEVINKLDKVKEEIE